MTILKLLCRIPAQKLAKMSLWFLILCLTGSFITACDTGKIKREKSKIDPPPFKEARAPTLDEVRDIAKPASPQEGISVNAIQFAQRPDLVETDPKGFKPMVLFPEEKLNDDARFARLEQAVQNLSNQMQQIEPAVTRLVAVDDDMNILMRQLEILIADNQTESPRLDLELKQPLAQEVKAPLPAPPPPAEKIIEAKQQPAKKPKQTAEQMAAAALNAVMPASGGNKAQETLPIQNPVISAIRIADHADKTRIVFDSPQKLPFESLFQQNGQLAVRFHGIEKTDFLAIKINEQSRFVRDIYVAKNNDALLFDLVKPMVQAAAEHIPPNAKNPSHRYYIDLK